MYTFLEVTFCCLMLLCTCDLHLSLFLLIVPLGMLYAYRLIICHLFSPSTGADDSHYSMGALCLLLLEEGGENTVIPSSCVWICTDGDYNERKSLIPYVFSE